MTIYQAGETPESGSLFRAIKVDGQGSPLVTADGDLVDVRLVSEREAVGRFLGAFEHNSRRDNIVATLRAGKPLFVTGWRVEFVG